jgi:hypothetical protein
MNNIFSDDLQVKVSATMWRPADPSRKLMLKKLMSQKSTNRARRGRMMGLAIAVSKVFFQ